ncbi:MAG: Fic family protein [Bacteroidetes bacterium]|nr:MAG: Fic family protein [Bacteroidota bacterium]
MEGKDLQKLIHEIDSLKIEYEALLPMKPEDEERLWRKLRLEWNYNSNHIEGSTLTYGETYLLLIKEQIAGTHDLREIEEMRSHDIAISMVMQWAKEDNRQLTEADIRGLNELLLVRPFRKEAITPEGRPTTRLIVPGEYKKYPNHVLLPDGTRFEYATPEDVPALMNELINWYNNETEDLHPLTVAATFHYRLVRIHPFDDGNGRVARLLMNYHLMRKGYLPAIIKSSDKKGYLAALGQADAGMLEAFIAYVGKQLIWSYELAIRAAQGEEIEEKEDWKKQLELLKQKARAVGNETTPKTPELLEARLRDSIIPLFRELDAHLALFDELFLNKEINWFTGSSNPVNSEEELIAKSRDGQLAAVRYLARFTGYKYNGVHPFDMTVDVRVEFEEYFYTARLVNAGIRIPAKKYDTPFSEDEIEEFISKVGKYFTEFLEKATGGP